MRLMRFIRFIRLPVLCGVLLFTQATALAAEYHQSIGETDIPSQIERSFDAAVLIDLTAGAVLYQKNAEQTFTPTGGAVSLMTAYIVRQEADWGQEIPIIDDVRDLPSSTRKLDLEPGKRWLVKDLAAGILLHGAQDAALVLCDHVSGSQDAFVELMNQYAQRLGMENTVYKNSLGAYASGQTATVMDTVRLCEAVLEDETLRELLGKNTYDTLNGQTIQNRMEIMQEELSSYDARVKGLGEGSTTAAGTNTILYVIDDDRVCLFIGYTRKNDQKASEKAAITLLDYFLDNYELIDAQALANQLLNEKLISIDGGAFVVSALSDAQCLIAIEKSISETATLANSTAFSLSELPDVDGPVSLGADLGSVTLLYQGQPVKEVDIIAKEVLTPEETTPLIDEISQEGYVEIPVYTADDWKGLHKEKTFIVQYGCYIIIGASILLAGAVLTVASRFRRK